MLLISLHVQAEELVMLVKTNRHFNTCVNEYLFFRTKLPTFLNTLVSASKGYKDKCDISCFKVLDHASTYSQLI